LNALLLSTLLCLAAPAAAESSPPAVEVPDARPGPVFVIELKDSEGGSSVFTDWNLSYLRRCIKRARAGSAALLVVDITTYGGRVDISEKMSNELAAITDFPTAALVNERALSAGALVALACDRIFMTPSSRIGAATPWVATPEGGVANLPEKVEEKFVRNATVMFRLMAEKKGRNGALAAAMVDPEIEVVAVNDGKKLVPMTREEFETAAKKPGGRLMTEESVIVKKGTILILSADEAVNWKLASQTASRKELLVACGLSQREVVNMIPDWGERLAEFCSSGLVVGLLVSIAMMALYVELNKPSGLGAGIFMAALATFFWANYLAGTADPISIVLFLLGLALLLVEIFFIPGFGVTGIAGIVLMLAGMVGARLPAEVFSPSLPTLTPPGLRWTWLGDAVTPLLVGFAGGCIGIMLTLRFFPHLPFLGRLVLRTDMGAAVVSAAQAAGAISVESMTGLTGTATTKLRPGGSARIGGRLLDVVSDGDFIEAGTPVVVISAAGNRILVRRAKS
jgi:membrane-bound serine protease (ClpP class)